MSQDFKNWGLVNFSSYMFVGIILVEYSEF